MFLWWLYWCLLFFCVITLFAFCCVKCCCFGDIFIVDLDQYLIFLLAVSVRCIECFFYSYSFSSSTTERTILITTVTDYYYTAYYFHSNIYNTISRSCFADKQLLLLDYYTIQSHYLIFITVPLLIFMSRIVPNRIRYCKKLYRMQSAWSVTYSEWTNTMKKFAVYWMGVRAYLWTQQKQEMGN